MRATDRCIFCTCNDTCIDVCGSSDDELMHRQGPGAEGWSEVPPHPLTTYLARHLLCTAPLQCQRMHLAPGTPFHPRLLPSRPLTPTCTRSTYSVQTLLAGGRRTSASQRHPKPPPSPQRLPRPVAIPPPRQGRGGGSAYSSHGLPRHHPAAAAARPCGGSASSRCSSLNRIRLRFCSPSKTRNRTRKGAASATAAGEHTIA